MRGYVAILALLLCSLPAKATPAVDTAARDEEGSMSPASAHPGTIRARLGRPQTSAQGFAHVSVEALTNGGKIVGAHRAGGFSWYPRAFSWEHGVFTDLDPTDRWGESIALAANDRGQVVGCAAIDAASSEGEEVWRPILWEHGEAVDLFESFDDPGRYRKGIAWAINERGQVVVVAQNWNPFLTPRTSAFLWDRGKVTPLGAAEWFAPNGYSYQALAGARINARGDVIGSHGNGSFFWREGVRTELAFSARALNNHGQVVGGSYLWEAGNLTDLGSLSDSPTSATAINDRGDVAGQSQGIPWRWREGVMEQLPDPMGCPAYVICGINARGQIVGFYNLLGGFAICLWGTQWFVWDGDAVVDLVPEGGFDVSNPNPILINDAGKVTVNWTGQFEPYRGAFLWQHGSRVRLDAPAAAAPVAPVSQSPAPTEEQLGVESGVEAEHPAVTGITHVSPNPASGPIRVRLALAEGARVHASVMDLLGRHVRVLADEFLGAGEHELAWDGADEAGLRTSPGLYLLRVRAGGRVFTSRVMRVR